MLRAVAIMILLIPLFEKVPQQPSSIAPRSTCAFSEIYKAEGWTVPGLKDASIQMRGNVKMRGTFADLPGVIFTTLEPVNVETMITEVNCSRDHEGRLEIMDKPIRILELTQYEYKGRVFAYGLEYEKNVIHNGERGRLGAASGYLFYDTDGSGRFTIRKWANWPFLPSVPPDIPN
jgi:hypothetical protein